MSILVLPRMVEVGTSVTLTFCRWCDCHHEAGKHVPAHISNWPIMQRTGDQVV